jgi:mitogen-activated protein kinase organizer 1
VVVHAHDIVAGSVDGTVRRFDIRMGRVYSDNLHHAVTSVALSHDGQCVLAACLDSKLRLDLNRLEACDEHTRRGPSPRR